MRTINNRRPKAFIGAAISVGTQLIGGIIGGAKRRKAEEAARLEQERQAKLQAAQQQASYMTENAENDANVYKNIRNQLMRNGGNIPRKGAAPLIAEGGTAIPIKKDSFLLKGRKHNTGGIIIGKGKNSIEAEGDEVVQITPKQLKVFSAQPILNGNSPAELVQKGAEPSKVFNAQENFKDRNGLNDDGTKKKAMGGKEKKESGLARTSRSQLMQRVPKYNRLYINRGDFGGGQGGGAGTGTKFHPSDDLYTISKTDTLYVPVERNFNDAFSEARRSGQTTFDFQGKKYNTQLGDNPNNYAAGQSRKEETIVPIVRKRTIRTSNPNTKLKLGGLSRKKYQSLLGDYQGRNEGIAIRSLRDARTNPNYQYNSTDNSPSTPSLNSELKPLEVKKAEPKTPKKQSFNSAFAEARRNGLKVFEWNGKKYGTKLASEVEKPKSKNISSADKAKTLSKPKAKRDIEIANTDKFKSEFNTFRSKLKDYSVSQLDSIINASYNPVVQTGRGIDANYNYAARQIANEYKAGAARNEKRNRQYRKKALLGVGTNRRLLALTQNMPSAGITAGAKIINPSASSIKPMNLSSNNGSKGFNLFKGVDKGEAISSGIGAVGTLISGLLNKGSIDKTSAPQVPTPQLIAPAKLKTSVNINPQLSDVRESELSQNRLVEGNTASSVASVARQQRISNNALSQRSRLRGEKENLETQLQNQDAINRQQVASSNAQQINEANRFNSISATQTANDKIQATANNRTQMIEGITSGVRDYQLGVDKKRSEENATAAMMSANPEQMELFLKLMDKNKSRLGNIRSTLFRCGGKKKIA